MAKFRAPSTSFASIASTTAQSARVQGTKPKKLRATSRSHKLDKAKIAAKDAAKRAYKTKQVFQPSTVYVGNIGPDVDESALRAHFGTCGKILSAKIHCSGGVTMTVKPPPDDYHKNKNIRQFAVIVFQSKSARLKACQLEGMLGGREPIVCVAVSDLPEVREKIVKRLDEYRSRLEPADQRRAQKSALKSLQLEPTDILDPKYENRWQIRNPFQFIGLMFRAGLTCIM